MSLCQISTKLKDENFLSHLTYVCIIVQSQLDRKLKVSDLDSKELAHRRRRSRRILEVAGQLGVEDPGAGQAGMNRFLLPVGPTIVPVKTTFIGLLLWKTAIPSDDSQSSLSAF